MEENKFQLKCAELVARDVLVNQSQTVELIISVYGDGVHTRNFYDDLENLYSDTCPHCGNVPDLDPDFDGDAVCESCGKDIEYLESETKEVYEWWAVSDWLAAKLTEQGEVMYDGPDCKIWGRCTTGQAIALDGVIRSITKGLG